MGHTAVKYGGLIILSRKFKSFSIHHYLGVIQLGECVIWDHDVGSSNLSTQTKSFYFSISFPLCLYGNKMKYEYAIRKLQITVRML